MLWANNIKNDKHIRGYFISNVPWSALMGCRKVRYVLKHVKHFVYVKWQV